MAKFTCAGMKPVYASEIGIAAAVFAERLARRNSRAATILSVRRLENGVFVAETKLRGERQGIYFSVSDADNTH